MSNKKFLVQYTGTGQGVSRSVVELPIDEKLEGSALDTKIRALAEMKIKKSNRRDRGTIRIISIKPYNDSAEDSMDDKITYIAAKYGHEMQNDAAGKKSIGGDELNLRKSAQKAVDAVVAATRKAKAACDAYSKALQKAKGPNAAWTTVDFEGIMDVIKRGGSPKVW